MWSRTVEMLNPYAAILASAKDSCVIETRETLWQKLSKLFKKG